jgi:hypothetical protein
MVILLLVECLEHSNFVGMLREGRVAGKPSLLRFLVNAPLDAVARGDDQIVDTTQKSARAVAADLAGKLAHCRTGFRDRMPQTRRPMHQDSLTQHVGGSKRR